MEDKDAQQLGELLHVLSQVDVWLRRMDPAAANPRPLLGSPLRADDERTAPYHLSHAAWNSLSHAVDHLNCLRTLLKDGQMIHIYAPFPLVRPALENASAAVWILRPRSRRERIERRLRLAADDIRNGEQARKLTGTVGSRSEQERLDQIRAIANGAGVDPSAALRRAGYREIIEEANGIDGPGPDVVALCWRLCSGVAHGDFWTTLNVADKMVLPGASSDVASFKITANVGLLMYVTTFAAKPTQLGWHLYDQRSSPPY